MHNPARARCMAPNPAPVAHGAFFVIGESSWNPGDRRSRPEHTVALATAIFPGVSGGTGAARALFDDAAAPSAGWRSGWLTGVGAAKRGLLRSSRPDSSCRACARDGSGTRTPWGRPGEHRIPRADPSSGSFILCLETCGVGSRCNQEANHAGIQTRHRLAQHPGWRVRGRTRLTVSPGHIR